MHPVLGQTYRVVIDKDKQLQCEKVVRQYEAFVKPYAAQIEDGKEASAITEGGNIITNRLCLSKVAVITAILQSLLFQRSSYRCCMSDPFIVVDQLIMLHLVHNQNGHHRSYSTTGDDPSKQEFQITPSKRNKLGKIDSSSSDEESKEQSRKRNRMLLRLL